MAPLGRDHLVYAGRFTLKGDRLTFTTDSSHLVYDAKLAKHTGRDFTVTLSTGGLDDFTGAVESIDLIAAGTKPQSWGLSMLRKAGRE